MGYGTAEAISPKGRFPKQTFHQMGQSYHNVG